MILAFPVALVSSMRMELKRKITLLAVLSLGVFSVSERNLDETIARCLTDSSRRQILTAILNRYYNFANPNSLVYVFWYVGESSTALMVANLPLCWPLLQWLLNAGPWTEAGSKSHPNAPRHKQPRTGRFDRRSRRSDSPTLLSGFSTINSTSTHDGYETGKTDESRGEQKGPAVNAVATFPEQEIELGFTSPGRSALDRTPSHNGGSTGLSRSDGAKVSSSFVV